MTRRMASGLKGPSQPRMEHGSDERHGVLSVFPRCSIRSSRRTGPSSTPDLLNSTSRLDQLRDPLSHRWKMDGARIRLVSWRLVRVPSVFHPWLKKPRSLLPARPPELEPPPRSAQRRVGNPPGSGRFPVGFTHPAQDPANGFSHLISSLPLRQGFVKQAELFTPRIARPASACRIVCPDCPGSRESR
jgi:hypothetical protein